MPGASQSVDRDDDDDRCGERDEGSLVTLGPPPLPDVQRRQIHQTVAGGDV